MTNLKDGSTGDCIAQTDARLRNWYDNRELVRSPELTYSVLFAVPPSRLPPMVDDRPERWIRQVPGATSSDDQPTVMLLAGQFWGDMPGTYWARWGRYAAEENSVGLPARLRLDPNTRFVSLAITNHQIIGQFVDGTVLNKFLGTLESEGAIEVGNPLEIRGGVASHGTIRIRRGLIAPAENPAESGFVRSWLQLEGPALSALGGTITLEHESASLEFGSQTKAVAENLLIRGQGTLNVRFLDGEVKLGEPGNSFTLLGELDHGRMQIGPSVQIQVTEGGFYNGGVIELIGPATRVGTPGWLGPNNHDMRTTIAGSGRLEVKDGAILELVAGYHAPDYWRRWSVVIENDLDISPEGTLHTVPFTGPSGSWDSPVEIRGALVNRGRIQLDRSLLASGNVDNTGTIVIKDVEFNLNGGQTASLGGSVQLENAALRTTGGSAIAANNLRVTGSGTFDARLDFGTATLGASNNWFQLTPQVGAGAHLLVDGGTRCLVPESGLLNEGVIALSGADTVLGTPNWLGANNHDMRTTISGRGTLRVQDGAVLELTAGWHSPDYWRRWSVVIENDVVIGPGGTLHTVPFTGPSGSWDSPVEIHGRLVNNGKIILERTLLVEGQVQNSGRLEVNAPLQTTNRVVNSGELVLNAPLSAPELVSEGGSILVSQLTIGAGERFSGNATINGNLANHGVVSPGQSPGLIEITGNYSQTGELVAEVRGAANQDFDRLTVGGQAQLGGKLQVRLLPGANFASGAVFDIIKGAAVSGTFDPVLLPVIHGSPLFDLSYGPDFVRLTALQAAPPPPALIIPAQNLAEIGTQGLRLQIQNLANGPFVVEFSSDLQHWEPVLALPDGALPAELLMLHTNNGAMGFYRGIQPP